MDFLVVCILKAKENNKTKNTNKAKSKAKEKGKHKRLLYKNTLHIPKNSNKKKKEKDQKAR